MADASDRPAFYALAPGGWRDYWTLLHPPYTVWHLSYVVMGAALAPVVSIRWLVETLIAFFLAMGVAAHALDELNGRPLGTRIPSGVLVGLAVVGLGGAVALGVDGAREVSPWISAFIVAGVFLVLAYNLELLGGRIHTNLWFALAWGAFPVLTAAFAQSARIRPEAVVMAAACAAISAAQRRLSTPVRDLRRHALRVEGRIELRDGETTPIDATTLRDAPEAGLRWLSLAMPLIATAVLLARVV
jgi:hypothetical protein